MVGIQGGRVVQGTIFLSKYNLVLGGSTLIIDHRVIPLSDFNPGPEVSVHCWPPPEKHDPATGVAMVQEVKLAVDRWVQSVQLRDCATYLHELLSWFQETLNIIYHRPHNYDDMVDGKNRAPLAMPETVLKLV